MVGNSLKSDILPVLELGGRGVHVPYRITWAAEHADPPSEARGRFFTIENLNALPPLLESIAAE
jgi:putative hydrolase of the HAD superfamily